MTTAALPVTDVAAVIFKLFNTYSNICMKSIFPHKHAFKDFWLGLRYLKFKPNSGKKRIGLMRVDGRFYHGGLNDRFKGAVSWWNYCQKNGLEFRLLYNHPFDLTEYVVPNEYDWRIDEKDIPDGIFETRIFYGRGERGYRLDRLKTGKNVWYYGNIDLGRYLKKEPYTADWGEIFRKLFRPSELVESHLVRLRKEINGPYVAAVYRFQNLLGDFPEYHYEELSDPEASARLMARALEELAKVHEENPGLRVLVTSDSCKFLAEAAKRDYVFVIPGKVEHMDSSGRDIDHTQLKSFLDYFMIAEARKVYSIVIGRMYRSEFPEYAAKIYNRPFIRRSFDD